MFVVSLCSCFFPNPLKSGMDWEKSNYTTRQQTFKFWDLVRIVLEIWLFVEIIVEMLRL